jgi:hypothetical protein
MEISFFLRLCKTSPSELLASPSELLASPSELLASPSELTLNAKIWSRSVLSCSGVKSPWMSKRTSGSAHVQSASRG